MAWQNKDFVEKDEKRPWYKCITTEPPMFLYMMAYMLTSVVEQTFYLFRACNVNHGYSAEICHNISSYRDINLAVQVTMANFSQWSQVSSHVIPLCLAFFLGAWSDKRGRKAVLLVGLVGKLFFSCMVTLCTMNDWPLEYVIYFAFIPSSITGADLAIFAACFAYVADVTDVHNRTLRIGILDGVYLSTMPTGVALGKYLYNNVFEKSFTALFAINSALMALATLYTIFFLEWQTTPQQKSLKEAGVKNPFKDFFDFNHVSQTFRTLCKRRTNNRRLFLWFLLISMALYTFQRDERPMMYLYTIAVFQWGLTDFSNFRTYLTSAYVVVMLVGIPLMSRVLKLRDTTIVMLGATSHMAGHFIYAQATAGWVFYVGGTAAAMGPCVAPLVRSMTSKLLGPSERGVAYTFLSVMENAVAMFASIIYSQLYTATLETAPNSIFYLTLGTQAIVFTFAASMEILLRGKSIDSIQDKEEKDLSTTDSAGEGLECGWETPQKDKCQS